MNNGTLVFTAPQVCEISQIEYSKLDYWVRNEILKPDFAIAEGRGSKRLYSYRNIISLTVANRLRGEGLSSQKLKNIVNYLHDNHEMIIAKISHSQDDLIYMTDGNELHDFPMDFKVFQRMLTNKELFWLLPLGTIVKEINERIAEVKAVKAG